MVSFPNTVKHTLSQARKGIDFCALSLRRETNPLRLAIINIVDGYGIRVAVIAVHGKYARRLDSNNSFAIAMLISFFFCGFL